MIIVKDQVSKILFQEYPKNEFDASDPRFLFLVFPKNFLKFYIIGSLFQKSKILFVALFLKY